MFNTDFFLLISNIKTYEESRITALGVKGKD